MLLVAAAAFTLALGVAVLRLPVTSFEHRL
jgi:hypothetical protein